MKKLLFLILAMMVFALPLLAKGSNDNSSTKTVSGAVIYCIAPPTGSSDIHADYNLKTIGWNDRISSIGWVLVNDLSILEGDNPQFPAHKDC